MIKRKLSEIALDCIENGTGCRRYKNCVEFDMDFHEAVESAYILLGLDSDEVATPVIYWPNDFEFEIEW